MSQYKFSLAYKAEINKEISSSIKYEMYIEKSSTRITGETFTQDTPTIIQSIQTSTLE